LIGGVLVGVMSAKMIAAVHKIPFIAVNHLEGHALTARLTDHVAFPFLLLLVSGGHCQLLAVDGVGRYRRLGTTVDDAAGEAFDKVAKMLGLPYPGGPEIDKLASQGRADAYAFPRSFHDGHSLEFSFSGLKTAVLYELPKLDLRNPATLADVCASVQEAILEVLVEKLILAARQCREKLVTVSGGVSCNRGLRAKLSARCEKEGLTLLLARPELCTDNAGMIAYAAMQRFQLGQTSPLTADVDPNLPLVA
jgi:N6-L-threonylcarbamoyladenine synthase